MSFMIESEKQCPFLMYRLVVKKKHLPPLSAINLPLVEFIYTLTAFYHLPLRLVLFKHSPTDAREFAQVGLNCTIN